MSAAARSKARCASAFAASEAARSAARTSIVARAAAQVCGVRRVRHCLERGHVVRGDDLDDLVLLGAEGVREELRRGEVLRLALAARERFVCDALDDVLQERVLAALGRQRIGLDGEDLLAQRATARSGSSSGSARPLSELSPCLMKVLPSTAPSWTIRRSSADKPSRRAAISACSVSGTSSFSTAPVGR